MKRFVLSLILLAVLSVPAVAQESKFDKTPTTITTSIEETKGKRGLARTIRKAARKAAREGKITAKQRQQVVLGTIIPATLERIEDGLVQQMLASGEDTSTILEMSDSGVVNRASIDWGNLADFIERMIPIILQIIQIFSGLGA